MSWGNTRSTFSAEVHEETVRKIREKSETVNRENEDKFTKTGKLDPNVDVRHGEIRVSHNVVGEVEGKNGLYLPLGIKLPISSCFDGTGSMGRELIDSIFTSMGRFFTMTNGIVGDTFQADVSGSLVQDVLDATPPLQFGQFESGQKAATQIRSLVPAYDGGDIPEDHQLLYLYLSDRVDLDIIRYGLKGISFLITDAEGRETVDPYTVKKHLGFEIQSGISTKSICQKHLSKWHSFVLQVRKTGEPVRDEVTRWWEDKLGAGRVILVKDRRLLAETMAGLIYVLMNTNPSGENFINFFRKTFQGLSTNDAVTVWGWLESAKIHFGAQAKLMEVNKIPLPGAGPFADKRDLFPIGWNNQTIVPEMPTDSSINWENC